MSDEICWYRSTDLVRAYGDGSLSPVEVAKATLARIDHLNPLFNTFSFIDPDVTLSMARASEERWRRRQPLGLGDGVPTTIKDNMSVVGWPRRSGSLTVDETPSSFDSPCVARLREAGCVFLGKTTTPEFAWKGVTDSPLNGITRNPWNPEFTPGGSSGGAAVAALLGMGTWHVASDAAGSIRIPAAFCGVQGFKPTFGVVPNFPASVFSGLGHHGPIARHVSELAAMMAVISQPDIRDSAAAPPRLLDFSAPPDWDMRGARIGYLRGGHEVDAGIAEAMKRALLIFEDLGAVVDELALDFRDAREQIESYWRIGCALLVDSIPMELRPLLDRGLVDKAERACDVSAMRFRALELSRLELASTLQAAYQRFDLLVTPVVPIQPFAVGHDVPVGGPSDDWIDWTPFTYPFNLTHQPTAAIACGLTAQGLPTALQIIGPRFGDLTVLRAAAAFEASSPVPPPPILGTATWPIQTQSG